MQILPKKKNYILLFLIIFISIITFATQANASEYEFDFAKRFGGTGSDVSRSVVIDTDGNKYIVGYFSGTVNFGGGNLISAGSFDIFVLKLDENGDFVWVETFGGASADLGINITVDTNGNLYITGIFTGTVDFGSGDIIATGVEDIFVLKLDEDGNYVWVETFGGTGNDSGNSVSVDSDGNSYITGVFSGTVDFGGGDRVSAGNTDIFVLKLDEDGNYVWDYHKQNISSISGNSIKVDETNDVVYLGGTDYDNNTLRQRGLVTKINNTNGSVIWEEILDSVNGISQINDISFDVDGSIYVVGHFNNIVDFGNGDVTPIGNNDVFVLKLDEDGNYVWVETFGGTNSDIGRSITQDDDYIYVTGNARYNNFNVTIENITANAYIHFITQISKSTGEIQWIKGINDIGIFSTISGISIDNSNNLHIIGHFSGTPDFDPSSSTSNLTSAGNTDIFLLKLSPILIAPTVTTTSSSPGVTTSSVTANITDLGTSSVTNRGFEYGTSVSYGSTISESGTYSTGSYSLNLTNLTCNTLYHYRPFATNATGPSYGTDATFTTLACPVNGAVSLAFLIHMNQQNQLNNPEAPTQPQPLTNCKSGDIFSNTTGERCNTPLPPFNTNLSLNSNNQDILKLQQFLNKNNYTLAQTGPGSPNNETNFFGPLTRNALIRFQIANNITPAIGYFGPITRARVNQMLNN